MNFNIEEHARRKRQAKSDYENMLIGGKFSRKEINEAHERITEKKRKRNEGLGLFR